MAASRSPELNSPAWEAQARAKQQSISQLLGHRKWDLIPRYNSSLLDAKVGYALYNEPPCAPEASNCYTGYTSSQREKIRSFSDHLVQDLDFDKCDLLFSCVYIVAGLENRDVVLPVLRIARHGNPPVPVVATEDPLMQVLVLALQHARPLITPPVPSKVIDTWHQREYESWDNFVAEERLPVGSRYCAPGEGFYTFDVLGNVITVFRTARTEDLSTLDKVMSFIPGVGQVHGIVRGAMVLDDMRSHNQRLDTKEAGQQWLQIGMSFLGPSGAIPVAFTKDSDAGSAPSWGSDASETAANMASPISSAACYMVLKNLFAARRKRCLIPLDFWRTIVSFKFYVNATLKFENPSQVVAQAQRDFLNRQRAGYQGPPSPSIGPQNIQTHLQFNVGSTQELWDAIRKIESNNSIDVENAVFTTDYAAQMKPNRRHLTWLQVDEQSRLDVFHSAERCWNKVSEINTNNRLEKHEQESQIVATRNQHLEELKGLSQIFTIDFEQAHQQSLQFFCDAISKESSTPVANMDHVLLNSSPVFAQLSSQNNTKLGLLVHETFRNDYQVFYLAHLFAEYANCKTVSRYIELAQYFAATFDEKKLQLKMAFLQKLIQGESYEQVRAHIEQLLKDAGIEIDAALSSWDAAAGVLARNHFADPATRSQEFQKLLQNFRRVETFEGTADCLHSTVFKEELQFADYRQLKTFQKQEENIVDIKSEDFFAIATAVSGCNVDESNAVLGRFGSCSLVTCKIGPAIIVLVANTVQDGSRSLSGVAAVMSYQCAGPS